MSMIDQSDAERAIAERINPTTMATVELSQNSGGLGFTNMAEVMQFAKIMAISGSAVPPHCRGNVGVCMAITIQAVEWRLSPFAVANKSYEVNGRMAYESQLIQAVILQRAPIKGRFDVTFSGEGQTRRCTVTATLREGGEKNYTSPELGQIKVQNSPLWKSDPDQQLSYYAGRALCRRHFPDVLLGIYTPEELYETAPPRGPEHARDVTPKKTLEEKLDSIAAGGNGERDFVSESSHNRLNAADPPHDPETGEIMVRTDPVTARAYAANAAAGLELPDALDEERKDAGAVTPPETAPASDPIFDNLLSQARAKAKEGPAAYKKWHNRISAPDFERIEPYLADVLAEAAGGAK